MLLSPSVCSITNGKQESNDEQKVCLVCPLTDWNTRRDGGPDERT